MSGKNFQSCIDACNACALACDRCAAACLQEDDVKMMASCIAMDIDCSQLCRMAAGFMARDSRSAASICQLCAEVCKACANECGKHKAELCRQCAEACRRCVDECTSMTAA